MIRAPQLSAYIKKCIRKGIRFNFLGFVENKELSPLVESYFTVIAPSGARGYDWVNGNELLEELIEDIKQDMAK